MNHGYNLLCFFPRSCPQGFQTFQGIDHYDAAAAEDTLAYHVAVLRNRVQQLEPLVGMLVSPAAQHVRHEVAAMAVSSASSVLQDVTTAASAVERRLEQMGVDAVCSSRVAVADDEPLFVACEGNASPFDYETRVFGDAAVTAHAVVRTASVIGLSMPTSGKVSASECAHGGYNIVELAAADLLAKYTHYCQVCGKGFKREANLRMHMRSHGDEYKTSAALSNPTAVAPAAKAKYYSCPVEGCRWNRRHPRFQPLKSAVCAKNHYRRRHCPKMYACRRCAGGKQFAILSDLRTHEKHCGELRWRCSCGTFFSRKDKLMSHVALFAGHAPAAETSSENL